MSTITNQAMQSTTFHHGSALLHPSEIDVLLTKLARGHLSTLQEEYDVLKKALAVG